MKEFTREEWKQMIRTRAKYILYKTVTGEYEEELYNLIEDDVVEEMFLTFGIEDEGCFSETDVKYAIGRVLIDRLSK